MKKWFLVPITIAMLGLLLLSGCTAFASPEELAAVQSELTTAQNRIESLEAQVATLATISAYNVWYDQYYAKGAYRFADADSFHEKLGSLVKATGNETSKTSWSSYITSDKTLSDIVTELPEDTSTWTQEQYAQWYEAGANRYKSLGEVGAALFSSITQ